MEQTISSVEKCRKEINDYLKKEDMYYVNRRSKKAIVDFYRKKEPVHDPWLQCFYFGDNESKKYSDKPSICFTSSQNLKNIKIAEIISNCSSITDEELNYCKAALRREARSRNFPDLSSKPDDLRLLFLKHSEEFPENFRLQRKIHGEIVCNMMNFEVSLNDCLKILKPLSEISIADDATIDAVTANIISMRNMMKDFQTSAALVVENICKVAEKFERYQEFDEKMDRDIFDFLAHFFSNFLVPRNMRKKGIIRK